VYSGCLTSAYGPCVISFPLGTQMSMSATDHAQIATPTAKTMTEVTRRTAGGPPTLNTDGYAAFRIRPTTRNGNVNSPIT
jgi:hypothetical protein